MLVIVSNAKLLASLSEPAHYIFERVGGVTYNS